jgi:uncharacterized protein
VPDALNEIKQLPAIDGWWDVGESGAPHLTGSRCPACGTYVYPGCRATSLEPVALSRRGTLWSYTENRYAPPPPYPVPDPFEPFAIAAVQLAEEGLIVLGKVAAPTLAADLRIGMDMELTLEPLFRDDDGIERTTYAWRTA